MKLTYQTDLTVKDLHRWLDEKASEEEGLVIKHRIFWTKKMPNGFIIARRTTRNSFSIPDTIFGTINEMGTLEIKIHSNNVLIWICRLAVFGGIFFIAMNVIVKGIGSAFSSLPLDVIVILAICAIVVIYPKRSTQKWIERELGLETEKLSEKPHKK